MIAAPRILAIGTTYSELVDGYRRRKAEVLATFEDIDHVTGLPANYSAKLMTPGPMKVMGPLSFPLVNEALGVGWALVELEPAEVVAQRHNYHSLEKVGRRPRAGKGVP